MSDKDNFEDKYPNIENTDMPEKKKKKGFLPWLFGRGGADAVKTGAGRAGQGGVAGIRGVAARGASKGTGQLLRTGASRAGGRGIFAGLGIGKGIFATKAGIIGVLVSGAAIGVGMLALGGFFSGDKDVFTKGLFEGSLYNDTARGSGLEKKASKALGYFSGLGSKAKRTNVETEDLQAYQSDLSGLEGEIPAEYEDTAQALAEDMIADETDSSSDKAAFRSSFSNTNNFHSGGNSSASEQDGYGMDNKGIDANELEPMSRAGAASTERADISRARGGRTTAYGGLHYAKQTLARSTGLGDQVSKGAAVKSFENNSGTDEIVTTGEGMGYGEQNTVPPTNSETNSPGSGLGLGDIGGGGGGGSDLCALVNCPAGQYCAYGQCFDEAGEENEATDDNDNDDNEDESSSNTGLFVLAGAIVGAGIGLLAFKTLVAAALGCGAGALVGLFVGWLVKSIRERKKRKLKEKLDKKMDEKTKQIEDNLKNSEIYKDYLNDRKDR